MQQTGLPALLGRLGLRFDPTAAMYMLFNFITSVGIVFANKVRAVSPTPSLER